MSEVKSSRREVSVKGEREPAGRRMCLCVERTTGGGDGESGHSHSSCCEEWAEMGCEKACVLPPVRLDVRLCVVRMTGPLYKGRWRGTQKATGQESYYKNLNVRKWRQVLKIASIFLNRRDTKYQKDCIPLGEWALPRWPLHVGWSAPPVMRGALVVFKYLGLRSPAQGRVAF